LIGRGDMLLNVGSNIVRLQCAFVDTPEVERVIDHISDQQGNAVGVQQSWSYHGSNGEAWNSRPS